MWLMRMRPSRSVLKALSSLAHSMGQSESGRPASARPVEWLWLWVWSCGAVELERRGAARRGSAAVSRLDQLAEVS